MTLQSYLFVPGAKERIIKKALSSPSDLVIIDFEDAVAEHEKANARQLLAQVEEEVKVRQDATIVRINGLDTDYWQEDLLAVFKSSIQSVMLPKCESAEDIHQLIGFIEHNCANNFLIIPLIESAKGVLNAYEIAASHDSVKTLAFGAVDYALDIGAKLSKNESELLFARSMLVNACAAAKIGGPIDCPYLDFSDEAGFLESADNAQKLGMVGKLLIHPKQVQWLQQLNQYSEEEILESRAIVQLFEEALENGKGAISYQGRMIDYPVYKQAKDTLLRQPSG